MQAALPLLFLDLLQVTYCYWKYLEMLTTTAGLVGLATLAGSVNATPLQARDSWSDKYARCNALWEEAPKHLADLTVNLANYVDAGTTINETANGAFIPVGTDLGPFCRFSANITTSDKSSVRFEVWLPDDDAWNGVSLITIFGYWTG